MTEEKNSKEEQNKSITSVIIYERKMMNDKGKSSEVKGTSGSVHTPASSSSVCCAAHYFLGVTVAEILFGPGNPQLPFRLNIVRVRMIYLVPGVVLW